MRSSSTWVRCSARVIAASFASSAFVTLSQRSANSVRARCAFSATAVTWATSACSLEPALDVVLRDQRLAHRAFGRFQLLGLLAQLVPGRVEELLGGPRALRQPLHLHLEVGDVVARRRALALAQCLEAVAQRLLGLELGLELAEVLARRRKLALALVMSGADHGEAVRLLAGCGPQGPGLVLEHLDRLAGVGELTLVARDNEIVRLRLLAQRRVLLDESMGTLGLAPDLALELGGVRLLLAEVAADRGERRLLLLRALAQLVVVRAQAAELVLELEVLALEAADLLRQRAVPLALAGRIDSVSRSFALSCGSSAAKAAIGSSSWAKSFLRLATSSRRSAIWLMRARTSSSSMPMAPSAKLASGCPPRSSSWPLPCRCCGRPAMCESRSSLG